MDLQELMNSKELFVSARDVEGILNTHANDIRRQAHEAPEKLGFPVIVINRRVRIPRIPFLKSLGVDV